MYNDDDIEAAVNVLTERLINATDEQITEVVEALDGYKMIADNEKIRQLIREKRIDPGNVPCNGCTKCCQKFDMIRLLPGDDPTHYQIVPHKLLPGDWMLDHKPNGDCIYLDEHGCTIQETKPIMCKEMDCRLIALHLSFTKARKMAKINLNFEVWKKGKELLGRLK